MASNNPHYEADGKEIEEETGGLYYCKIRPRALNIVWGKDDRYWRLPKADQKDEAAELLQVCWLEVSCSKILDVSKRYQIGFNVSLTSDAFGWSGCPVYIMAKLGKKGKYSWKKLFLTGNNNDKLDIPDDFFFDIPSPVPSDDEKTLYFGLYEVWSGKWKGGLRIHHAFIKETK